MVGRRKEVVGLEVIVVAHEKAGERGGGEKGWEDARREGETPLEGESVEGRSGGEVGADVICAAIRDTGEVTKRNDHAQTFKPISYTVMLELQGLLGVHKTMQQCNVLASEAVDWHDLHLLAVIQDECAQLVEALYTERHVSIADRTGGEREAADVRQASHYAAESERAPLAAEGRESGAAVEIAWWGHEDETSLG